MPQKFPQMEPVRFDEFFVDTIKLKSDPAFREITTGLNKQIIEMLRDPGKVGLSCCFEGCCVSWCCIQVV